MRRRDELVVVTHNPGEWCEPGKTIERHGTTWTISRIRKIRVDRGPHRCWQIWGRT